MSARQTLAKTYHKDYEITNNENYFNPDKEQQRPQTQLVTNSYKQVNTYLSYNYSTSNDDDDIFGDDVLAEDADNDDAVAAVVDDADATSV